MPIEKSKNGRKTKATSWDGKRITTGKVSKNAKKYKQVTTDKDKKTKQIAVEKTYAKRKKGNRINKTNMKSLVKKGGKDVIKTEKYKSDRKTGKEKSTTSYKPATKRRMKALLK